MPLLPVLICNPGANLKSGQYFNPACFAPPGPGQIGNVIWPYIKGPPLFNSDLSLYKNFAIREKQKIQFRFEAFNFLNHPLPEFNALGNNADVTLRFSNAAGNLVPTNQNSSTNGFPQYTVNRPRDRICAKVHVLESLDLSRQQSKGGGQVAVPFFVSLHHRTRYS